MKRRQPLPQNEPSVTERVLRSTRARMIESQRRLDLIFSILVRGYTDHSTFLDDPFKCPCCGKPYEWNEFLGGVKR